MTVTKWHAAKQLWEELGLDTPSRRIAELVLERFGFVMTPQQANGVKQQMRHPTQRRMLRQMLKELGRARCEEILDELEKEGKST